MGGSLQVSLPILGVLCYSDNLNVSTNKTDLRYMSTEINTYTNTCNFIKIRYAIYGFATCLYSLSNLSLNCFPQDIQLYLRAATL